MKADNFFFYVEAEIRLWMLNKNWNTVFDVEWECVNEIRFWKFNENWNTVLNIKRFRMLNENWNACLNVE